MTSRQTFLLAALGLAASCGSGTTDVTPTPNSSVRVINASGAPFDVQVDGQTLVTGVGVASVSAPIPVVAGSHRVRLSRSGVYADVDVNATPATTATAVGLPSQTGIAATVLADTGSIVPVGKSKLRVVHLAANAPPVDVWRTQPDYHTPIHVMTPFNYQASSPYLQSDPGDWEVWITPKDSTRKLVTTGAVTVPSGERRTVVFLDSAGVLRLRVLGE